MDYKDAVLIAKQKIFDLASEARHAFEKYENRNNYCIMNIKCAEDHLIEIEDYYGRTPLKNCILEMIRNELKIDNFYIATERTILVRIDRKTIDISAFKNN